MTTPIQFDTKIPLPETWENGFLPVKESYTITAWLILLDKSTTEPSFKKVPKTTKAYLGFYAKKKFKIKDLAEQAIQHLNSERRRQNLEKIEYTIEGGGAAEIHNKMVREKGFNCVVCGRPIRKVKYSEKIHYFHQNMNADKHHQAKPTMIARDEFGNEI